MSWIELKLALGNLDAGRVEAALLAAGAVSVTLEDAGDQPLYEPEPDSLWSQARLTGLFPADADMDGVRAVLLASLALEHLPAHRIEPLEDRDWSREWLKDFKPMRFGRRLWICPTAYAPPDPAAVNLILDPGLAFGTGTHPTTALCLEWLDAAEVTGLQVIDYGCGSGILAIAAARLGARHVWAVDHDPQALTATHDNAARNRVLATLSISNTAGLPEGLQAGLLLANILARPLLELAPRFATLLAPGATAVLSGILVDQDHPIRRAYAPWFDHVATAKREDWLRLVLVRRAV